MNLPREEQCLANMEWDSGVGRLEEISLMTTELAGPRAPPLLAAAW